MLKMKTKNNYLYDSLLTEARVEPEREILGKVMEEGSLKNYYIGRV